MATEEFREALKEPHLHLQVSILNTFIITISIVVTKVTFAIVIAPVFENHYTSVVIFILNVDFFTNDHYDLQKEAERLLENETNENLPEGQLRAQVKIEYVPSNSCDSPHTFLILRSRKPFPSWKDS